MLTFNSPQDIEAFREEIERRQMIESKEAKSEEEAAPTGGAEVETCS